MKRRSLRGFPFTRHYFSRQLMPNANGQRIIISYLVPRGLNSPRRGRAARSKFDCRNKRGHLKFMGRVFLHAAPGNMLITRLLLMRERVVFLFLPFAIAKTRASERDHYQFMCNYKSHLICCAEESNRVTERINCVPAMMIAP